MRVGTNCSNSHDPGVILAYPHVIEAIVVPLKGLHMCTWRATNADMHVIKKLPVERHAPQHCCCHTLHIKSPQPSNHPRSQCVGQPALDITFEPSLHLPPLVPFHNFLGKPCQCGTQLIEMQHALQAASDHSPTKACLVGSPLLPKPLSPPSS